MTYPAQALNLLSQSIHKRPDGKQVTRFLSRQENEDGRILEIHLYYPAMAPSLSVSLPGSLSVSWYLISLPPFTDLWAEPTLSPLDQLGKATLPTL